MATFIKGDAIILYVYDTDAYKPIACLTSNSLNQTQSIIDAQTKCEPGQIIRQGGTQSYELAFEGLYIDTTSATSPDLDKISHDALHLIMGGAQVSQWKMDTGLTDTVAYYGDAIISDLNWDNAAGDEFATFSGTLMGSGLIVTVEPSH